jgi:hypothetical protein
MAVAVQRATPTTFEVWCKPETNTVSDLKVRTDSARVIYDRDVRHITRIFAKDKRIPGSPTDYSVSIDDLKETIETVQSIIEDALEKLKKFETKCSNVLFTVDRMGARVYSYLQKGAAGLGATGVGASLFYTRTTTETTGTDSTSGTPPLVGWIGFGIMISAYTLNWTKEYVDAQKKEQKQFQKILEENKRMKAAHQASIVMLNSLQLNYEEGMAQLADPEAHAEAASHLLSHQLEQELVENFFSNGEPIPDHIQRACSPDALRRAMLNRGGNHKREVQGNRPVATPVNSPERYEPASSEDPVAPKPRTDLSEVELSSPSAV